MKLFVFYNPTTKELITVIEETYVLAVQWLNKKALNSSGFYLTTFSALDQKSYSFTSIAVFDKLKKENKLL